jgi:alkyl hydroperoxide reductase subunit AhpF
LIYSNLTPGSEGCRLPAIDDGSGAFELNGNAEVPVGCGQSTAVAGLSTADDASDEPDKQVIVVAGAGARAALAADRHLAERPE